MKKIYLSSIAGLLLLSSCNENAKTANQLKVLENRVGVLQSDLKSINSKLKALQIKPLNNMMDIYKRALTIKSNRYFVQQALKGMVSEKGGLPVILNFILKNMSNENSPYASGLIVNNFVGHPDQENCLREIITTDLSEYAGGQKLSSAKQSINVAFNYLFRKFPAEFVDQYLDKAFDNIITSKFDPSGMADIYTNVLISFKHSDKAKKGMRHTRHILIGLTNIN